MTMNIIIGGVCFAVAGFLYLSTLGYPYQSSIGITPGTWPRMIAYLIGLLSVILVIQGIASKEWHSGNLFKRRKVEPVIVPGIIVASIVIYIFVWSHWRTFFLPTFVLTTIIVTLLKQNKKSILDYLMSGSIGLTLTAIIHYVFYYVFRLPL